MGFHGSVNIPARHIGSVMGYTDEFVGILGSKKNGLWPMAPSCNWVVKSDVLSTNNQGQTVNAQLSS